MTAIKELRARSRTAFTGDAQRRGDGDSGCVIAEVLKVTVEELLE